MNGNEDKKQKKYCCSNPNCLKVFSEPLEIKHYACPECKSLIDLNSNAVSDSQILPEEYTLKKNQRQEANSQNEKQQKVSEPVVAIQDKKTETKITKTQPVSDQIEFDYFALKDPEPQEPTLQQRLEAMVERKHKEATKQNDTPSSDSGCLHYFGYLHQKQKDEVMPETCVVCPRAIECLMSDSNSSKESLKEIKKWYSF